MRKVFLIHIIFFLCVLVSCQNFKDNYLMDYCYIINDQIKELEFFKAYIRNGKIELFNENNEKSMEILFAQYEEKFDIKYIRKENNNIYFIFSGMVDDEEGIMFINDESNHVLDGIKKIKRVGGNVYQYSTED